MIKYPVLCVCAHSLIQSKGDEKKFSFLDVEPFRSISFACSSFSTPVVGLADFHFHIS